MSNVQDREAVQNDPDVRRRAREVCTLIGTSKCLDPVGETDSKKRCDYANCYVWELIEMGRVGHPE